MLVPVNWLKNYTDVDVDIDTFAEKMILSGSNIETVTKMGGSLENIVVGRVKSVRDHENSDHLVITMVDVGRGEDIQIVTGAPNVREDILVPIALDGAKLPGGLKIKKSKLRGEESNGMMCSHSELGFDDKVVPVAHKDGIWIMNETYEPGTPISEALDLDDYVVDFEITPNRPDCLSIFGMAKESAATFEKELTLPDHKSKDEHGKAKDFIEIEIRKPDLCPRYVAKIVTDVVIEESPWWMQQRLMYAGMRPINNIVDVTNYVLLELGHPIHAFDITTIESGSIVVDTAEDGTKFTTLDETEREVDSSMLMIKDGDKPVAIAGVMGGLNSEIKDDTTTILVESANFNQDSVRLTSKKLGLRTEASSRYEKGLDANLSLEAAERVCHLIELIGAGNVVKGAVDEYPNKQKPELIQLRVDRVNKLLGTNLERKEVESLLKRLDMTCAGVGNIVEIIPPTTRIDLKEEIDMIEEVARMYGYDKLAMTVHKDVCESGLSYSREIRALSANTLIALGYDEIQTYSFTSPSSAPNINAEVDDTRYVKLINPLGDETSVMRQILLPNLVEVMGRNYTRGNERALLFEIGNTFTNTEGELPNERYALSVGAYGEGIDFFTLKGDLSELFVKLGIEGITYRASQEYATYHPGRCAELIFDGKIVGTIGELHPDILDQFDINTRAVAGEIDMETLIADAETMRYYSPLPVYPTVERDISFVTDESLSVMDIEDTIRSAQSKLLEDIKLFDVYRGEQVPEGKKSLAFNLVYRADDRTLTDEEVVKDHDKVLTALKDKLDIVIRDN